MSPTPRHLADTVFCAVFCGVHALVVLAALLTPSGWAQAMEVSQSPSTPRVDFHSPPRDYSAIPGLAQAYAETSLVRGDPALYERASRKLSAVLPVVFAALPPHARRELASVRFYLLWGAASPQGGRPSGMRYVRRGEPSPKNGHDPRWQHVIIIYSAENLMYLDELWSRKALVHELAHAWHVTHWSDRHAPIQQAWAHAVSQGLYKDVPDHKNKVIATAYAAKNPLEYFAELSAARFVGINYHPFNAQGLKQYDPMGHDMVEALWAPVP